MAAAVPTGLSRRAARHFGLAVGAIFLAVGVLQNWRGRPHLALAFAGLGVGLVVFGALFPAALVPVRRAWMAMAAGTSKVTTPVFMAIVYFGVLSPIGAARRLVGQNPLKPRRKSNSLWVSRELGRPKPEDMEHQF